MSLAPWHSRGGGQGNRTGGGNLFCWLQYEALPKEVRAVLQVAPISLGTDRATRALRQGWNLRAVIAQEVNIARQCSQCDIDADYGPDHPQSSRARHGA